MLGLSKRFLKMDILITAQLYEADLKEIVNELVQRRVMRQTYTLLLTRFWFYSDWDPFLFP